MVFQAAAQPALAFAPHGELLQRLSRGKREPHGHAGPVHQLSGMQVRTGPDPGNSFPVCRQQVRGTSGQMHRQEGILLPEACSLHRRGKMSPLVCGGVKGNIQRCRQQASGRVSHLEHGHIGLLSVPGLGAGANRGNPPAPQGIAKGFLAAADLAYVRKNGLTLAESPLPA